MSIEVLDGYGIPPMTMRIDPDLVTLAEMQMANRRRVLFIHKEDGGNESNDLALSYTQKAVDILRLHGRVIIHSIDKDGNKISTTLSSLVYAGSEEERRAMLHVREARHQKGEHVIE